ncbi:hypothetical protein ACJJIF_03560 [Microbulbifer sp. SSSA002]|uniref:hypothetical protein n=1 Tax=Microbulbifer sp. SSSA002 TaxID=3243376 RepID=UPI004039FA41
MDQRTETHILCTSGGRNLVASKKTAQLWSRISSSATHTKAPNYHAVGAYMAIRGLLAKPNDFDTHSMVDNQRIKVKTERGYQLSYTLLSDGDIYLNDIQIDFENESFEQSEKGDTIYRVSTEKESDNNNKLIWKASAIKLSQLKISPSSVTHILISDSNMLQPKECAAYGPPVINSGHPEHTIGEGDKFYMFHRPKEKFIKGFFRLRRPDPVNKEAKFINEIVNVIAGAARISANEYQRRQTAYEGPIQKLKKNVDANKALGNPDLGNISTQNQREIFKKKGDKVQKAKDIKFGAAAKIGLPDPVVCWTTTGNGDKTFNQAVKKAAQIVNVGNIYGGELNSHKLQHVFLNNYTVNDNRLDRSMANIGMEWSSKRGTRSPVSLKNQLKDSFYSSEYKLLKRRSQVAMKDSEYDKLHPAFRATDTDELYDTLKAVAPIGSKPRLGDAAVSGLAAGGTGTYAAVSKAGGVKEAEALLAQSDVLLEKTTVALNQGLGTVYKLLDIVGDSIGSEASTFGMWTAAGIAVTTMTAKYMRGGPMRKAKLLYGQARHGNLSSMPTSELANVKKALRFHANLSVSSSEV